MKRTPLGFAIIYTVIASIWATLFGAHIYLMKQPTSVYFVETVTAGDLLLIVLQGMVMVLAVAFAIINWIRYIKERKTKTEDAT